MFWFPERPLMNLDLPDNTTMVIMPIRSKPETESNPYRLKKLIVIVDLLRAEQDDCIYQFPESTNTALYPL